MPFNTIKQNLDIPEKKKQSSPERTDIHPHIDALVVALFYVSVRAHSVPKCQMVLQGHRKDSQFERIIKDYHIISLLFTTDVMISN